MSDAIGDDNAEQPSPLLSEAELAALAQRFGGAEVAGLALTGSHARGVATRYSDVDLLRFTQQGPTSEHERYRIWLLNGRLVSVTTSTLTAKRAELTQPESAIFAVAGLRQARILSDREGRLAALLAAARAFSWTPALRAAADAYVSEMLGGLAEEVAKLLGGLERADESAVLYAALGLQQSLTRAALVARGVLLRSENEWFAAALALEPPGSRWQALLRHVVGFDALPIGAAPAVVRGQAALQLYVEAARLLGDALTPDDAALVATSVARIRAALGE